MLIIVSPDITSNRSVSSVHVVTLYAEGPLHARAERINLIKTIFGSQKSSVVLATLVTKVPFIPYYGDQSLTPCWGIQCF